MNILILGSGGREHALAWKITQSELCDNLFITPGNGGTGEFGENCSVEVTDFEGIKNLCLEKNIMMVVVGPEDPLVLGIYDFFKNEDTLKDIMVIGPSKDAAQLEGSKAFAKSFMQRHNIPTASYKEFNVATYDEGIQYIKNHSLPIVLKADGLAAGKGVIISHETNDALKEFEAMIKSSKFGIAGSKVVIEEFLTGIEMSLFVLSDGKHYKIFPEAKDYKRIGEGDTGLNTGGMGAISPVPFASELFMEKVIKRIIQPTVKGLQEEKLEYKGIIFLGLIKVDDEPFVIEYNCRFGDPETEAVLTRLQSDLVALFMATHNGRLHHEEIVIDNRCAATIVAVSGGYPEVYQKELPIQLNYLNNIEAPIHISKDGGVAVFHSGTKLDEGVLKTNGGRVFAVTSLADTIGEAVEGSLEVLSQIYFDNMYYRTDIGKEFLD